MKYIKYLTLFSLFLISGCSNHQVKQSSEIPVGKVNIISKCNDECKFALKKQYGLRVSTTSELWAHHDTDLASIYTQQIVSIDRNYKKKYHSSWSGFVDIMIESGEHQVYGHEKKLIFEGELKEGQYSFAVYFISFGWSACWFPFVYEYNTGKFLLPKTKEIKWLKGKPLIMNADAIRLTLKGIKDNPKQCENMKQYLKGSYLLK